MSNEIASTLGILAGGGSVPGHVARTALATGRPVFMLGFEGFADPSVLAPYPHEFVRLGAAGRIRDLLMAHACRDLVMVGTIRRPSLLAIRPDAFGVQVLARIGRAAFAGDDTILSAVVRVLNEDGFSVRAVEDVLSEALAPVGLLSKLAPDASATADIERGVAVVQALGRVDVGQGAIVQQGMVLAVEAAEGTDQMLIRAAELARPGPGGVLVKLVKPGQDRRLDLPTLGPESVRLAVAAGLRGIAFEGSGTLIVERASMVSAADAAGLFLLGLDPAMLGNARYGEPR
ncbi:MAG: LpxI family protein [Acetobacteraceae bacterium]